jgi:hypothetical protein
MDKRIEVGKRFPCLSHLSNALVLASSVEGTCPFSSLPRLPIFAESTMALRAREEDENEIEWGGDWQTEVDRSLVL